MEDPPAMPTATKNTTPAPPAAAVAADAHWAAKMERLRKRNLAETTFVICDDQEVRDRHTRALRAFDRAQDYAKANADDTEAAQELAAATAERDAAQAAYDQASIAIRFRALPRPAYEALFKAHPASEAETEEGDQWGAGYPAALIAASCVDGMSEDDARELLASWSLAEANALFNAAYGVQHTTRTDLGKG
jgi:hypothetical protein